MPNPPSACGLYDLEVRAASGPPVETPPCPCCRGTCARLRFFVETVAAPVVVCAGCGLGSFHPMPDPGAVASFYPDAYYGAPGRKFQPLIEGVVRLVGARHIGFLSADLRPGDRVLDVGCGRGVTLGPLADRGLEVHGLELSRAATRGADPRADIRIASSLSEAGFPAAYFQQVVIWHVLEHLREPRETLLETQRILAPGGRLIVAVPNFASLQARWFGAAWFHLDLPRHLYHFPLPTLLRLLRDTGFEIESEHHFSIRQNPFGWIQSLQNKLGRLPRNALYQILQRNGAKGSGLGRATRVLLYALFASLTPFAFAAAALETALRSGATVHVVARRGTAAHS